MCITRPIASSCPHQTSPHQTHHLRAPLPRRQAPRSHSAHLYRALPYYKCFALPIVKPLSVLTEFYSVRLPNDVLRELILHRPKDTHCARFLVCFCELQVWSRVAMVEVGNLIYW